MVQRKLRLIEGIWESFLEWWQLSLSFEVFDRWKNIMDPGRNLHKVPVIWGLGFHSRKKAAVGDVERICGVEWEINCKWMECLTYFLVIPFFITMWRCINIQSISRMSHDAVTLFRTQKSIPNNACVSPLTIPYPVMSPSQGFPCQSLPYSFYLRFHRPNSLCRNYLMLLL